MPGKAVLARSSAWADSVLFGSALSASLFCTSTSLAANGPAIVASTSQRASVRNFVRLPEISLCQNIVVSSRDSGRGAAACDTDPGAVDVHEHGSQDPGGGGPSTTEFHRRVAHNELRSDLLSGSQKEAQVP